MRADQEHGEGSHLQAFITPPRCRVSGRELAVFEALERFELAPSAQRAGLNGRSIRGYSAGRGPKVLLLHGWGGRAAQFAAFVNPLVSAGFQVLAFDAAAHGESAGESTSVFEFVDSLAAAQKMFGELHALVGHSLGGASVLMALAAKSIRSERALLIAPTPRLIDETEKFANRMELSAEGLKGLRRGLEQRFGGDIWKRTNLLDLAPSVSVETHLIHDELDPDVPHQDGLNLAQALPQGSIHSTRGLGHLTILRAPAVVQRSVEFIGI